MLLAKGRQGRAERCLHSSPCGEGVRPLRQRGRLRYQIRHHQHRVDPPHDSQAPSFRRCGAI
ncbi:hypothetical protein EMPG_13738 [Blastomyces silverae]|uniref:Uncharacterized protein n=1 Tax=Blastomyces silverae TaxID=2060906 RepID=A0A0H1BP47_9EURO|nr:hypothetical protein EMPG_13738 [Blastomyces silverae]